ncbi:MAG: ATP-binding protein [Myxococcota bacterium]
MNWDNRDHRQIILGGPASIAEHADSSRLREQPPVLVLDEIHKWSDWKDLLKGLFDTYSEKLDIIVTGSAQLDVYRHGGDSLMGRYFPYRMHPLSVAELLSPERPDDSALQAPSELAQGDFERLRQMGGFPEPFERNDRQFYNRWRRLRSQLLFQEDLRELTRIRELGQVETLSMFVADRVGATVNYSSFSRDIGASVNTIKSWLETLERLYYCFSVRPWHKNVTRALRKQPKYYLWDWSVIDDEGARTENLVASALLKAVHFWTDVGLGEFGLHFIRDKQQHEVDFVVVRDREPWFLVEVKSSASKSLSGSLERFQEQTGAKHAFQVAMDAPYVDRDCFSVEEPTIVPALTFLSQLV